MRAVASWGCALLNAPQAPGCPGCLLPGTHCQEPEGAPGASQPCRSGAELASFAVICHLPTRWRCVLTATPAWCSCAGARDAGRRRPRCRTGAVVRGSGLELPSQQAGLPTGRSVSLLTPSLPVLAPDPIPSRLPLSLPQPRVLICHWVSRGWLGSEAGSAPWPHPGAQGAAPQVQLVLLLSLLSCHCYHD